MLRCSKCHRRYEESRQRFCPHDGGRLIEVENESFGRTYSTDSNKVSARLVEPIAEIHLPENRSDLLEIPETFLPEIAAKTDEIKDSAPLFNQNAQVTPANGNDVKYNTKPLETAKISGLSAVESPKSETTTSAFGDSASNVVENTSESGAEDEIRRSLGISRFVNPLIPPSESVSRSNLSVMNEDSAIKQYGTRPLNELPKTLSVSQNGFAKGAEVSASNESKEDVPLVKGRYRIETPLSSDTLTRNYLATDCVTPRRVLLTTIEKVISSDENLYTQFQNEKIALSHIKHSSIIGVLDSGETADGRSFVIREYVEGETLRSLLAREGKIDAETTAQIVRQVAQGLNEAHNNRLLHGDLRPEHIVLRRVENNGLTAQIDDFGIGLVRSHHVRFNNDAATWEAIAYRAPENLQNKNLSPESDVYSLAAIAFEMLTGKKPFAYQTDEGLLTAQRAGLGVVPSQIRPEIPPAVDEVLRKNLSFDRETRHHHAGEFGEAFFHAFDASATPSVNIAREDVPFESSDEVLTNETAVGKTSKSAFPLSWAVLGALLLVIGFGAYWFLTRQSAPLQTQSVTAPTPQVSQPLPKVETTPPPFANENIAPSVPQGFARFSNERDKVQGKLGERFVGFTVSYPSDWTIDSKIGTAQANNFLDVGNRVSNGSPIENLLVTWYGSKGTFAADAKNAVFAQVGQGVKAAYAKKFSNYKQSGEGRIVLPESNLEAYEIKFEGTTSNAKDENLKVWGKTYLIPVGREGANTGLAVTLLATSLSPKVQNVEDVGTKGELEAVLKSLRIN